MFGSAIRLFYQIIHILQQFACILLFFGAHQLQVESRGAALECENKAIAFGIDAGPDYIKVHRSDNLLGWADKKFGVI